LLSSLASDGRFGPEHPGQGADGPLGLGLLEMADDGIDQDDPEDHAGIDVFAEQGGLGRGDEEDVDEDLMELEQELLPPGGSGPFGHLIGTGTAETISDLGGAQAGLEAGLKDLTDLHLGPGMPGNVGGGAHPGSLVLEWRVARASSLPAGWATGGDTRG